MIVFIRVLVIREATFQFLDTVVLSFIMSLLLSFHVAALELREGHLLLDELHHDLLLFADASLLLLELTLGVEHFLLRSQSSLPGLFEISLDF